MIRLDGNTGEIEMLEVAEIV